MVFFYSYAKSKGILNQEELEAWARAGGAAGGAEEERRRNLERNTRLFRLFAEPAAKNDKEYWMAYLNFINDFYHHVWRRFEEDPSSGKPT